MSDAARLLRILCRRCWGGLWSRIVGRVWEDRLGPVTSWRIVAAVHPWGDPHG